MMIGPDNIKNRLETTMSFFDSIAGRERWVCWEDHEREFARQLIGAVPILPGDQVLEPGCGAGRLSVLLAEAAGAGGRVVSLDLSEEMIARARTRDRAGAASYLRASILAAPLGSSCMDVALCFNSFQHFGCPPLAVGEMARVLKPGGRLAIANSETLEDLDRTSHLPAAMRDNRMPPLSELVKILWAFGFNVRKLPRFDSCFLLVPSLKEKRRFP